MYYTPPQLLSIDLKESSYYNLFTITVENSGDTDQLINYLQTGYI